MKKKRLCVQCKKKTSGKMFYAHDDLGDGPDGIRRVLICKRCKKWIEDGVKAL